MSSMASSFFQRKLTFDYDIFLTFLNGLEDHIRTVLENCLRHLGLKTFFAGIINASAWGMAQRCRLVVVMITPEFARSDGCLERLMSLSWEAKTWFPFFLGVSQNKVREQFESLYSRRFENSLSLHLPTSEDSIFYWDLQQRVDAVRSSLFGFTLSP